jgi:hypothetical protein
MICGNLAFPVPGVGLVGRRGSRGEVEVGGNFQIQILKQKLELHFSFLTVGHFFIQRHVPKSLLKPEQSIQGWPIFNLKKNFNRH